MHAYSSMAGNDNFRADANHALINWCRVIFYWKKVRLIIDYAHLAFIGLNVYRPDPTENSI